MDYLIERGGQSHRRPAASAVLAATCLFLGLPAAKAAVITVSGACNLIAAIDAANTDLIAGSCPAGSGPDTIQLNADVELIAAHSSAEGPNGLPSITSEIEITGPFVKIERKTGSPEFRILHVGETGRLTLRGIEIAGGLAGGGSTRRGGGIYNEGTLSLVASTVSDNKVEAIGSAGGGGIYSNGPLSLTDSTVDSNLAHSTGTTARGGGIMFSGGTSAAMTIFGSTVSNNIVLSSTANAHGGGMWVRSTPNASITGTTIFNNAALASSGLAEGGGIQSLASLDLSDSTVSTNRAVSEAGRESQGGGVFAAFEFIGSPASGTIRQVTFRGNVVSPRPLSVSAALWADFRMTVSGSLFSGSTGSHCAGGFVDAGGNLADSSTCAPTIANTLSGLDPALSDNGGPTRTHALLGGSTAIDIAGSCGSSTDQRGAGRIVPCDAGAVETIGCAILELDNQFVSAPQVHTTCNTALLGPALVVTSNGDLEVTAGLLVTIKNDFFVFSTGEVRIGLDPALLPP